MHFVLDNGQIAQGVVLIDPHGAPVDGGGSGGAAALSRQLLVTPWLAIADDPAGTGYVPGDYLRQTDEYDLTTSPPTFLSTSWRNITAGATLASAPPLSDLAPVSALAQSVSISNFPATQPVSGTVIAAQGAAPYSQNLTQVAGASLSLGTQNAAASLPVTLASDQPQLPVFTKTSGMLAPVALTAANVKLVAQPCQRVMLQANTATFVNAGNDFPLTAGLPYVFEGVANTNTLSVRYASAAGTLYVRWEA